MVLYSQHQLLLFSFIHFMFWASIVDENKNTLRKEEEEERQQRRKC
jgi:hypothetical protein